MMRKLLAVNPASLDYISYYKVEVAHSFEEAKKMIMDAEDAGAPYDDLDLPVSDKKAFMKFFSWMKDTNRRYAFSIFGCKNVKQFIKIRDMARSKGFHFNT